MSESRSLSLQEVQDRLREQITGGAKPSPPVGASTACFWCRTECGGTCLGVTESTQMKTSDPAYWMLTDGHTSTPKIYREKCYICRDPEYAQMGLSLCNPCPRCTEKNDGQDAGHIAADDVTCDDCGLDLQAYCQDANQDLREYERMEQEWKAKEAG